MDIKTNCQSIRDTQGMHRHSPRPISEVACVDVRQKPCQEPGLSKSEWGEGQVGSGGTRGYMGLVGGYKGVRVLIGAGGLAVL